LLMENLTKDKSNKLLTLASLLCLSMLTQLALNLAST
jgi:hypothetical protein